MKHLLKKKVGKHKKGFHICQNVINDITKKNHGTHSTKHLLWKYAKTQTSLELEKLFAFSRFVTFLWASDLAINAAVSRRMRLHKHLVR